MANPRVLRRINSLVYRLLESSQIDLSKPLVVAVSGGADSLALLFAISDIRDTLNLRLHGTHLDHGLRGKQSKEDAQFVTEALQQLNIPATIERADVASFKSSHGLSLEEAARKVRYAFLKRVAQEIGASAIILGHTADDQAETVLMNLVRGTGLTGLRGMQSISKWRFIKDEPELTLVRPLLQVTHEETNAYCQVRGVMPRQDESNLSPEFTRNRLRNQLIPYLRNYNPKIRDSLIRLSQSAVQDLDYMNSQVEKAWPHVIEQKTWGLSISKDAFSALHPAIKNHLLRRAIREVKGDLDGVELGHIQDMVRLAQGHAGKRLDLPGDAVFSVDYKVATLTPRDIDPCPLPPFKGEHRLNIPGETLVLSWRVETTIESTEVLSKDVFTAYLDAQKADTELWLRTRSPGDRFHPLGMQQWKKLQDFMTDAKIPRSWRDRVPLVVSSQGIVWVVGYRIAEWAKVRKDSDRILRLKFHMQPKKSKAH